MNDHHLRLRRRPAARYHSPVDFKTLAGQTFGRTHPLRYASPNCKPDVASVMSEIVAMYRDWQLTITDHSATATTADGERFECHRQASAEDALRTSRRKVDRLQGPEVWDQDYEDGALR